MDSQLRAFRVLGERLATRLRTRFAPSAPNASASSAPASAQDPRSVLTAGEVMTRDVITIRPDLPITQAMQLMLQRDISGLPVVDGGKLVGIVTESDFLRHAEAGTASKRRRLIEVLVAPQQALTRYAGSQDRKVEEIMTTDLVSVSEDLPLDEVVGVMRKHELKRLLVLRDGHLVGVISRADLIAALVHASRAVIEAVRNNHRRRAQLARLEKDLWMHRIRRN